MSDKLKKLYEKRNRIHEQQKELLETAEAEKRELSTDEDEQYSKMDTEFETLSDEIETIKRGIDRRKKHEERGRMFDEMDDPGIRPEVANTDGEGGPSQRTNPRATEEYRSAYRTFLAHGMSGLSNTEHRALQADSDIIGGFIVAPEQFVKELIQAVDNEVFIRQFATVITVGAAQSLGAPSLDNDPSDPDWTAEVKTGSEDTSMSLGKRNLHPHPLSKRIKVSETLLRISTMSVDALVRSRLGYKFSIAQENGFLNGSGANQPLGIFTASSNGITTSRDVSDGNTATAISGDGLINAKYSLKAQYQRADKTRWIFHRDAIKGIRKLKDSNNEYIWRAGLASDKPDTILDIPYLMSEYCPNTFTANQYVGLIGDLRFYWIADALTVAVKVLDQLYAETNQVGYIGRLECDGMPVLEEAFARVKLGS